MDEISNSTWGEGMIRRAPMIGAASGAILTVAVGVLAGAAIRVPLLYQVLFYPGALLTWLFIYGDNGTHFQHMVAAIVLGTLINAIVGSLLGRLVRIACRRHFQVSLKAVLISVFWFSAALAVHAAFYHNRYDSWPIIGVVGALVGAGIGALGRRTLVGAACGVLVCIAAPCLLFGLVLLAQAWWDVRQALGWR